MRSCTMLYTQPLTVQISYKSRMPLAGLPIILLAINFMLAHVITILFIHFLDGCNFTGIPYIAPNLDSCGRTSAKLTSNQPCVEKTHDHLFFRVPRDDYNARSVKCQNMNLFRLSCIPTLSSFIRSCLT